MKKSVKNIFNQLQEEGFNISLLDYSKEDENEVWVAYALNQNEQQIKELKKYLKETGNLMESANDLIERIDELYTTLKNICRQN